MGTLYKRGSTYWIKYYDKGRPIFESCHSIKEADARRLLKRREGRIAEGKCLGVGFDKVAFEELAEDFFNDYRINKNESLAEAEQCLKKLTEWFASLRGTDITTSRIKGYIESRLGQEAAIANINRELSALKRMLYIGARSTPPRVDRVPFIPMLKESNVRKGFVEREEFWHCVKTSLSR